MGKPKSTAAEDLIESLLKEVEANQASGSGFSLDKLDGLPELDSSEAISLDVSEDLPNVELKEEAPSEAASEEAAEPIEELQLDEPTPDEKTRLGKMPTPLKSVDELDLSSIPDSDLAIKDELNIPDPDQIDFAKMDIPDPDKQRGGLLDIPDPDMKTTIRDIGDLERKVVGPAEIPSAPVSSEGMTQALPYDTPRRPDNTKTINLSQIPDNPPPTDSLMIPMEGSQVMPGTDAEKTLAVTAFANRNGMQEKNEEVKVSIGRVRTSSKGQVYTSADATLLQAENLRIVQQRVLELENEIDHLRQENEELGSAAEIIKTRADELNAQMQTANSQNTEIQETLRSEIMILKGNLQHRDQELSKARIKTDELESRLKMDLKKIRVRERELENRLELSRAEKNAIVRSKDENILELKRKQDQMQSEIDNYRQKCLELNKLLESNHDSFKKTTRALRLALANLELSEEAKSQLKKVD